ncbi:unnamed protein product [Rotaria sordida]|uniref:Uncharacterized protein n=2 Tax=Rotaria sordida TaxID=392033 RepID=A0A815G7P0_9BILA|nr:unnamed protein product [Rotaria sordida]CAF1334871.1 unnamed protein product [Rotaria sordida]
MAVETLKIYQNDPPNELTKQYGFMKFDENKLDATTRLSQYIRLSLNTNAETVVKFMQQGWHLSKPDLIISVTGGAKSFDMSTRLRKIFQSGLVAAAITTNAWLITAGTNAGVVKEVGEALNKYRYKNRKNGLNVPCIGIASWGYTAGNEQLDCQSTDFSIDTSTTSGIYPFIRHHHNQIIQSEKNDQYLVRNYIVKDKQKKRCDLESNHTHFLLFDDGQPKADTVLPLRAEIEKYSRNTSIETTTTEETIESLIPIVMVLVEGGPSSIRTICEALDSNTPVVVIKESGRAADLVAELHACYTENENGNGYPTRPQTGLVRGSSKETEINAILTKAQADITGLDEVKNNLCRVLNERKQLVTIFKFDSKRHHGNLEDAILESLFNAAKFSDDHNEQNRRTAELKLAIAWHKFNYAQKYLLTDTTISKWKEDDLRHALVDALHRGHVDFVELLIEFGTSLEKLTNGDLKQLYATTLTSNRLPVQDKGRNVICTRDDFYLDYLHLIIYNTNKNNKFSRLDDNIPLGKGAPQDLFLWAVFLNRFELATYLCSKTWNSSIAPLFGALIYRRAANLELDVDIKQQYEENADQFDTHAMSIIDRCFDNDERFAVDLLKRPAVAFNDVYPLQLARKVNCRSFLASKCVQKYLDHQWFGCINYKRTAINFRVFLCSLFFPLLPIFCIFLPYIQKHKKIIQSTRDQSNVSRSTMMHNVISFVLLVDYFPLNIYNERRSSIQNLRIPITEIILHICFWSFIIEEMRQFLFVNSKREYLSEIWNVIDMIATILYLIGFITRFIVLESSFVVSKIFLCLDLILWYVRTLELFAAFEKVGPKLIMIFNTMKDFLFFVCFILIFFLGYSISSWSLITTDNQAVGLHSHEDEKGLGHNHARKGDHDHSDGHSSVKVHDYQWKMFVAVLILYAFYLLEVFLHSFIRHKHNHSSARVKANSHSHSIRHHDSSNAVENGTIDVDLEHSHQHHNSTQSNLYRHTASEISHNSQSGSKNEEQTIAENQQPINFVAYMVLIGDGIHNVADGLAIGAAFSQDLLLGLTTTIAVACHELPHELGDYAILIQSGFTHFRALLRNFLSSLTAMIGFFIGAALSTNESSYQWIFAITVGMFLFISLVDLLPTLIDRDHFQWKRFICVNCGFLFGILIMFLLAIFEEKIIQGSL